MVGALAQVTRVVVHSNQIKSTLDTLLKFGRKGCEGMVLWIGAIDGSTATIEEVLVPPQESIQSEDGVGYFLETAALFEVNRYLAERHLRLIAQVHSHPGEAYHSTTDDTYAIVTTEGGLSLVVPDFGQAPAVLTAWAVYRLTNAKWKELSIESVSKLFEVTRR
jgi:hypothetical protein